MRKYRLAYTIKIDWNLKTLLCLILFSLPGSLISQNVNSDKNVNNYQLWLDLHLSLIANDKLDYFGDAGFRTFFNDRISERIYVRPSVRYHYRENITLLGGVGLFYSILHSESNNMEIRPWQGISVDWPSFKRIPALQRRLRVNHLVRLEQQIIFSSEETDFNPRARYKLSANLNLCKECGTRYWYIPTYLEFFFPFQNEVGGFFTNRNRLGTGIAYVQSRDWHYVFMANRFRSRSSKEEDFKISDYVFRISIYKRLHKSEAD